MEETNENADLTKVINPVKVSIDQSEMKKSIYMLEKQITYLSKRQDARKPPLLPPKAINPGFSSQGIKNYMALPHMKMLGPEKSPTRSN